MGIRPPKRETDCRVAALLAMTALRAGGAMWASPPTKAQEVRAYRADRVVRPYDGDGKRVRRGGGEDVPCGWFNAPAP